MPLTWNESQAAFAAALIDARLPLPGGIIECGGPGARRGFAVYRNTSLVTLLDVLQERFPVTCRLVGEEFFRAMARSYIGRRRPRSPLLISYGDDFPRFIDQFTPADDVQFLSDVARLEVAWSQAYHAADATPLDARALANMRPDALLETRLMLHPSTRILRSEYPIAQIWSTHLSSDDVTPPSTWGPQDVVIVRPDGEVEVNLLGSGLFAFVRALLDGQRVQDAAELAPLDGPAFDIGASIVNLFQLGVVVAFDTDDSQEKQE